MVIATTIEFDRALMKEDADTSDLMLVGFSDGGEPASAATLYLRSKRRKIGPDEETHEERLFTAKARVTPSSSAAGKLRKSTPRTEMRGFNLLVRLVTAILEGLPYVPILIFLATDSECTISALEAEDRILQEWFTNRVAEAQDHMSAWRRRGINVFPVHHWPGEDNIADLATKGQAKLDDIARGTEWQNGPRSLSYPIESWPASQDFKRDLPRGESQAASSRKRH